MRASKRILLYGGRLVLPDRLVEPGWVVIQDGAILDVSAAERLPSADECWDVQGGYVGPGLIDLHIHGSAGVDLLTATADDLRRWARFLLRHGVTRFLPTTVPADPAQYARVRAVLAEYVPEQDRDPSAASILGVHFEGPFVSPRRPGALNPRFFRTFRSLRDVEELLAWDIPARPFVRMMTLAPEIEGGLALIEELQRRGFRLAIGHSEASFELCEAAAGRGAAHVTHFPNALAPLHHRRLGVIGWALLSEMVTLDLIADGHHLDPRMIALVRKVVGSDRLALISDAIAAAGLSDGRYEIWGETIRVVNGRTENAAGNLAGSVITLLDAVRHLVQWGIPLPEAIRMATLVPARVLGLDGEFGSLAPGKRADLLVLDEQLQPRLVVHEGEIVRFPEDSSAPPLAHEATGAPPSRERVISPPREDG
jgi:N-acetylglucosamine-6-phosphate deacetylase